MIGGILTPGMLTRDSKEISFSGDGGERGGYCVLSSAGFQRVIKV